MTIQEIAPWSHVWAWAIPLIALSVITHVAGLVFLYEHVAPPLRRHRMRGRLSLRVPALIAVLTTAITALHGLEASAWALVYYLLGAFSDRPSAILYSIEAMTTYGHSAIELPPHWRLMGALEALNGMILFGLSTAFFFAMLELTGFFKAR